MFNQQVMLYFKGLFGVFLFLKNIPNYGRKGGDLYDDKDEQEGLYAG